MRTVVMLRCVMFAFLVLTSSLPSLASEPVTAHQKSPGDEALGADGDLCDLALRDPKRFAEHITRGATSNRERADAVVTWFAKSFDWTATDYKSRTVDEILARKGGNCAELAQVTTFILGQLDVPMRRVREINLHVAVSSPGSHRLERARIW